MHFSAPLVLVTAITGAHGLVLQRDTEPIIEVFSDIQAKVDDLRFAFRRWAGDPAPVLNATSNLVNTIEEGTDAVQGSANLTLNEALSLYSPVTDLKMHVDTLVDDINERKTDFRKARLCRVISSEITSIIDKSKDLAGITVSKVPQGVKHLAKTKHAQEIFDILERSSDRLLRRQLQELLIGARTLAYLDTNLLEY